MKNPGLGKFGYGLAIFGGLLILIDMLVPHTKEGTVNILSLSAPTGWATIVLGAVMVVLSYSKFTLNLPGGLGKIEEVLPDEPPAPVAPTVAPPAGGVPIPPGATVIKGPDVPK